jgi:hypothetical protein
MKQQHSRTIGTSTAEVGKVMPLHKETAPPTGQRSKPNHNKSPRQTGQEWKADD